MARAKTLQYHNPTPSPPLHIRRMVKGKHQLFQSSLLKSPTSGCSGEQNNACQCWGCQMEHEFKSHKCSTSVAGQGKRVMAENAVQESCPETGIHTNRKTCTSFLKNWGGRRSFQKSGGCSLHFSGYRTACIKLYFYRAWIISHSVIITGIILLSVSLTPTVLKIQKLQSQPCAVSSEPDCCIACIYWQRAGAGADTFQISLFKSAGLGPLSKNLTPSPFIPNSKYLTSAPGLMNNGSL